VGFLWREFAQLATMLEALPPGSATGVHREALLRSGISRLYYAAFHHALQRAKRNSWYSPTGKSKDHVELARSLKSQTNSGAKLAGKQLSDMRTFRNVCDYDLPGVFPTGTAGAQIDFESAFKQMQRAYRLVTSNV